MSVTDVSPPDTSPDDVPTRTPRRTLQPLALRLHFYAGLFVAPFILIAAVTGALYAISPTLEAFTSKDLLRVPVGQTEAPLAEQVRNGVAVRPDLTLVAVAPAPTPGDTTRVLLADPTLGESERRAVFVNPYTAEPVGDAVVYGSSGALPLRTWISQLHRHLHLGEPGRLYSELAASWLWVIALAGLVLWIRRVRARRARNSAAWLLAPDSAQRGRNRLLTWHGALGTWVLPMALVLSATGMTWSTYAGANIDELRAQLSWITPAVSGTLPGAEPAHAPGGDHHPAGHAPAPEVDPATRIAELDTVLAAARAEGVTQPPEITLPSAADQAFIVKERRIPGTYSADAVAVDGATAQVTDRLPYAEWPLMAKFTNWGIQFHMGLLFGLVNQLLLLVSMVGLSAVILLGYRMWWRRRPARATGLTLGGRAPRRGALRSTPLPLAVASVAAALLVGWFVPLFGLSLLGFLAIDFLLGLFNRAPAGTD
ncbi:PepSY-associated TM helix domain-containing protein [Nocardia sp. NPDC057227]|uniref:PepSY-associated TM helix domain-containing protein n=1 Tax=Nocardia sp. NPDC057227 TaxID=3346056 RepID=UPI003634CEF9